jgi:formylglycine-generating enzyme required for sulfatase activity
MAHIPGGNVFIGERVAPSQPRKSYEIGLEPYDIDVFEVTVAAYAACVETGRCPLPRKGGFCNWGKEKVDTHPINCVDQRQAERYCTWVNKRLPTSEEWEHAARGDDERRFPWGAAPPSPRRLNACGVECRILGADHDRVLGTMYEEDDGFPVTAPVGSFPAGKSPFGLHDVEGNVSEWTSSGFVDLPNWPTGFEKAYVVRGASWGSGREANAEVWAREGIDRNEAMETVGFRCAR